MKGTNKHMEASKLLNIMFHAPMGRFQLEFIYYITYFSTIVPSNSCVFLSCMPFVDNDERPTGKKHTTVGWINSGKIGKIIN